MFGGCGDLEFFAEGGDVGVGGAACESDIGDVGEGAHGFVEGETEEAIAARKTLGDPIGHFYKRTAPGTVNEVPAKIADHPAGEVGGLGDRRGQGRNVGQYQIDAILLEEGGFSGNHAELLGADLLELGQGGRFVHGDTVALDDADVKGGMTMDKVSRQVGFQQPAGCGGGQNHQQIGELFLNFSDDRGGASGMAKAVVGDGDVERGH